MGWSNRSQMQWMQSFCVWRMLEWKAMQVMLLQCHSNPRQLPIVRMRFVQLPSERIYPKFEQMQMWQYLLWKLPQEMQRLRKS